jgi:DivIVA domain-containing protein
VTLLLVVVGIAVVAGAALLVARDQPVLDDDPVEARALAWPPPGGVSPQGLAAVRFTVAMRGYRMDEVDRVLDDARAALLERDSRIADLERVVQVLAGRPQASSATVTRTTPAPGEAADPRPSATASAAHGQPEDQA